MLCRAQLLSTVPSHTLDVDVPGAGKASWSSHRHCCEPRCGFGVWEVSWRVIPSDSHPLASGETLVLLE